MICKCQRGRNAIKALKESSENDACILECIKSQFGYSVATIGGYCMPLECIMQIYGIEDPDAWVKERGESIKELAKDLELSRFGYYQE